MPESSIYFIIYLSNAEHDFTEAELTELLTKSRANNERDGITGMLLYKDRRFMQVLEGNERAVKTTFERIKRDSRHSEVVTLLDGKLAEREFPQWWMGFRAIDAEVARANPGFSEFLHAQWFAPDFHDDPSRAHQLLRVFRRL
jgi:hypothetical protein